MFFYIKLFELLLSISGIGPKSALGVLAIATVEDVKDSIVFHAGTTVKDQKVVTNGGRVLAITSLDSDFREAIKKSYQNIEKLSFNRMNYRTDIGFDL